MYLIWNHKYLMNYNLVRVCFVPVLFSKQDESKTFEEYPLLNAILSSLL